MYFWIFLPRYWSPCIQILTFWSSSAPSAVLDWRCSLALPCGSSRWSRSLTSPLKYEIRSEIRTSVSSLRITLLIFSSALLLLLESCLIVMIQLEHAIRLVIQKVTKSRIILPMLVVAIMRGQLFWRTCVDSQLGAQLIGPKFCDHLHAR